MKIIVHTENKDTVYTVTEPETVLSFLQKQGYALTAPCGGRGKCGQCLCRINGTLQKACSTMTEDGILLEPENTFITENVSDLPLTAAVDLGTTTVCAALYNLETMEKITEVRFDNPQKTFGADVITRIDAGNKDPHNRLIMQSTLLKHLKQACAPFGTIRKAVFAGNTVMEHLLSGHNPSSIAVYPFTAETLFHGEDGKSILPDGTEALLLPCIASYVGGDITAGLLACRERMKNRTLLFLDIGTNGELVLFKEGKMHACSVPAGPAFEGGEISCGSSDPSKAIVHFAMTETLTPIRTCEKPEGVCGSGILDLLAWLLEKEIVDETGRLLEKEEVPDRYADRILEEEEGYTSFRINETLTFSYKDVRMLQMAIASLSAGISTLLIETGTKAEEVEEVYLTGNFGSHLSIRSCIRTGMFPRVWEERITALGNTSLSGAERIVKDPSLRKEAEKIAVNTHYIELSQSDVFKKQYLEFMLLTEDKSWNIISL